MSGRESRGRPPDGRENLGRSPRLRSLGIRASLASAPPASAVRGFGHGGDDARANGREPLAHGQSRRPRRFAALAPLLPFLLGWSFFDPFHEHVEKGNRKAKEEGAATEALGHYGEAARVSPGSPIPDFNRGIVLSREGQVEEARDAFLGAAAAEDSKVAADALYNLGNTLLEAKQFEPSIEAYLQSLDIDPADADARRNLEIALRRLEEQQQQQQQQQDEQQQQEPKEQGDQGEDEQQQPSGQEESPPEQGDQEEQQQPQEEQQQPGRMTREDAERLLNAIQSDELKVLQQLQDDQEQDEADGKDW
jgi:tetratricopeptide (TPR) repeat protein